MTSLSVGDLLHKLPLSVATEMKEVAGYAGWVEANRLSALHCHRVDDDQNTMDEAFARLLEYDMPTKEACHIFRAMAIAASQYTANERMGDGKTAKQKQAEAESQRDLLVKTNKVNETLATNLLEMCAYCGWHASNSRKFGIGLYQRHADRDAEKVEEIFQRIHGEFRLCSVKFDADKIVATEMVKSPCCEGEFPNMSDLDQTKKFSYKHGKSVTHSTNTTVKWEFTLAGIVGGAYVVDGALMGGMKYSKSETQGVVFTDEEEKEHKHEFIVPPRRKAVARVVVEVSEAKIPYFMIFHVGKEGKFYYKKGIWSGVMLGKSTLEVVECIPFN